MDTLFVNDAYYSFVSYVYYSLASPVFNAFISFLTNLWLTQKVLSDTNPQESTSGSVKDYYKLLRKRFADFQKRKQGYRLQQLDMINKDKPMTQYKQRDLVYLIPS